MHYYKFNIGDYASHTQHLDPIEDIAYRRMLDWLYLNEMPLPSDVDDIARLIRMRSHSDCIATVLREFFQSHSDGYTHIRVERELSVYQERSNKAKKSAEARWKNKSSKTGGSGDANALRTECEGNANHKPLTINQEPLTNNINQSATDQLFDRFWASGIRKVNKKKAKLIFDRLIKSESDPELFANNLCQDVQKRIASGQLGFTEMHPTTYLNGERWNDDIRQPQPIGGSQKPLSASERVRQAISEKQAARSAAGGPGGNFGGQVMADAGGYVRSQAGEPVRGDSTGCVGEVLEGDFWPANSGRS